MLNILSIIWLFSNEISYLTMAEERCQFRDSLNTDTEPSLESRHYLFCARCKAEFSTNKAHQSLKLCTIYICFSKQRNPCFTGYKLLRSLIN